MPHDPAQLDYAPPVNRRWRARRFAAIAVVIVLAPLLVRWTLRAFEVQRIHRLFDRCASLDRTADMVVFDEAAPSTRQPFLWDDFLLAATSSQIASRGTLFVGALHTPSGQQRLVGVDLLRVSRSTHFASKSTDLAFHTRTFSPASALRMPKQTNSADRFVSLPIGDGVVRFFAGQRDPADASHFTIRWRVNNGALVIDGWLKDDNSVLLEVRP